MRVRKLSIAGCAAVLIAMSSAGAASAAERPAVATVGAPGSVLSVPGAYPGAPVVDSRHQHIFVSAREKTAPYTSEVLVFDMRGHLVDTITAGGIGALALSPDGRTVYASGEPVTAIDTATLKARYMGIGTDYMMSVGDLVITGGRLWFEAHLAGDASQWYIGSLDLRSRRVTYTAVPYDPADLATSVGAPNTLVASGYDAKDNSYYLDVFRTTRTGKLSKKAERFGWAQHLAVTRDGRYVVSTQEGVLRLSDLSSVRTLTPSGYQLNSVTVAPDGTIAVLAMQESTSYQKVLLFRECGWKLAKELDYGPVSTNGAGWIYALAWSRNSDQLYDLFVGQDASGSPSMELGITAVGR